MYQKILVALENSRADESLIPHIKQLALIHHSALHLVHVADGWVARNYDHLHLVESEEMKEDRRYLEQVSVQLRADGLTVTHELALGDPPTEILRLAETQHFDLIAMTTHGHRFVGDLIYGSTITKVRHKSTVPILLVRATQL